MEDTMSKIKELLASGKTVFTLDDMSARWGHEKRTDTSQSAKQYAKTGDLVRLRRGIYVLPGAMPTTSEIAGKLICPSYLTGEIILKKHGVSFQFDGRVTSAALISKKIKLSDTEYVYYKLNEQIFFNSSGIFMYATKASAKNSLAFFLQQLDFKQPLTPSSSFSSSNSLSTSARDPSKL